MSAPQVDPAVRLLRQEADAYRTALVTLLTTAGKPGRKTIDRAEVERIAGRGYEEGNRFHRLAREIREEVERGTTGRR